MGTHRFTISCSWSAETWCVVHRRTSFGKVGKSSLYFSQYGWLMKIIFFIVYKKKYINECQKSRIGTCTLGHHGWLLMIKNVCYLIFLINYLDEWINWDIFGTASQTFGHNEWLLVFKCTFFQRELKKSPWGESTRLSTFIFRILWLTMMTKLICLPENFHIAYANQISAQWKYFEFTTCVRCMDLWNCFNCKLQVIRLLLLQQLLLKLTTTTTTAKYYNYSHVLQLQQMTTTTGKK